MSKLQAVPISNINFKNKSYTLRHSFNVDDLEESIKYEGLLYPPILVKENGGFVIVAGYRRLLACQKLGKEEVECVIHEKGDLEKDELLKISIAENTKRKALKPVEIAEALLRIKNELQLSDEELASQFGETFNIGSDSEIVQKYLKLNLFDEESKDLLAESSSEDVEFTIADVEEPSDRNALLDIVREYKDIKKNQLKKIIDNAEKISQQGNSSLKGVFEEDSLKNILHDENLAGSKKINAFLGQLEHQANPEKKELLEGYNKLINGFKELLRNQPKDFSRKITLKKDGFGDNRLKITLDISNLEELTEMMKLLYDARKKYVEPIMKL